MKGEVVYLYAFDVANEILMNRVQEILSQRPFSFTIRDDRTLPKDIPLYRPLAIEVPFLNGFLQSRPLRSMVRVYEVGVISIAVRMSYDREKLSDLMPCHNPVLDDGRPLDRVVRDLCLEVYHGLKDVLVRSSPPTEPEAYTAFCITEMDGVTDVSSWLANERTAVAGLLTETDPQLLSQTQIAEVCRVQYSFTKTDLTVIDWDAALVVDLTGYVDDVLYVLELANLQLEEFRVMDQMLDRYLNEAYEHLERGQLPIWRRSSPMLGTLRRFRVDLTKLADEVSHITKFLGDWYLARVYLGARERFHLDQWRSSVDQRLGQLDRLYSVVHSEINERRMLWLEIIIVIFFAIDIIVLVLRR